MLGVWHFSLTVSDLERSIAFYQKLGLKLLLVPGTGQRLYESLGWV